MKPKEIIALAQLLNQPFSEAFNLQIDLVEGGVVERLTDQDMPIAAASIKAKRTNTGYIFIGFDDQKLLSTSNGRELEAKDHEMIPIDNANKINLLATVTGEGVEVILYK